MKMLEVLFIWLGEGNYDSEINEDTLNEIEKQYEGISGNQLYLVIHTDGGDPFPAVRIMRLLQDKFPAILTIIPSHAMSAGTLMALGTDKIYMQPKSMLGPLDLPMDHPHDGSRISALDIRNTISAISGFVDSVTRDKYNFLKYYCKLGKVQAAKLATETGTRLVEPVVKQIDPYHLQKSMRELKIGWFYARDLLMSRMMEKKKVQAKETAKALVNDFPAHEYGIFSNDAKKKLKLTVGKLDSLPEWEAIKPIFETINDLGKDVIIRKEVEYDDQKTKRKTTTKK